MSLHSSQREANRKAKEKKAEANLKRKLKRQQDKERKAHALKESKARVAAQRSQRAEIGLPNDLEDMEVDEEFGIMSYKKSSMRKTTSIDWPFIGDYVKVMYEKWFYGKVAGIVKEKKLLIVRYDNGEVYEEDFPGDNPDDLVVVTYNEYRKQREKVSDRLRREAVTLKS